MAAAMPAPPADMVMPRAAQLAFTVLLAIPLAVAILLAIRSWRRDRSPLPFLLLGGGLMAMLVEPIIDHLTLIWYPVEGQWTVFEALDIRIPLFVAMVYPWFVGGQAWLVWTLLSRRPTARHVWSLYGAICVVNLVIEAPGVVFNTYRYYGEQPFDFWGSPMIYYPINAAMPVVIGAIVYKLWPYLRGWRRLGILAIVPMIDLMTNAATLWPLWLTLSSGGPAAVVWLTGVLSVALALVFIWVVAMLIEPPTREPIRGVSDAGPLSDATTLPRLHLPTPASVGRSNRR